MHGLAKALAGALLFCLIGVAAQARDRDLGPIPLSGADAASTVPVRDQRVVSEMACGSEAAFMDGTRASPGSRPLTQVIAKAAVLAQTVQNQGCTLTQTFDPMEWDASFTIWQRGLAKPVTPPLSPPISLTDGSWDALKSAITSLDMGLNATPPGAFDPGATANANEIARLINLITTQTYGPACQSVVSGVTPWPQPTTAAQAAHVEYRVDYAISYACLARQVDYVILAPDLGRNGNNPGTTGLPCDLYGKAADGDWDQAITYFTRIDYLLHRAGLAQALPAETSQAIEKLETRLMTLSGGPAQEVHPVWSCGNPDNQYGSAQDRVNGQTYYDPDLQKDVSGNGDGNKPGDDFWGFLLLLLAILLMAAALAAALIAALGPATAAAVLAALLAAAFAANLPQLILGALLGGLEETENHLLMQNSAKYLMNEILMQQLSDQADDEDLAKYQKFNSDIHEWLMTRLHRIARDDFAEYNAKPYSRLSATALINLYDFSCQAEFGYLSHDRVCGSENGPLTTGVGAVFDLTAAKAALGSNQARRVVPFRRLSQTNTDYTDGPLQKDNSRGAPYHILEFGGDADHWLAAMQLWTAQTFHGPDGYASDNSLGEMIWEATSAYSPHALILDLALDKSTPYKQTYHHAGWERYSSGPAWLLTAGGVQTGFAQGFRTPLGTIYPSLIKDADRGAGVPTTLIVTAGQRAPPCGIGGACRQNPLTPPSVIQPRREDLYSDFVRFEGKVVNWPKEDTDEPRSYDNNFCVYGSFACGINLKVPDWLSACIQTGRGEPRHPGRVISVIDSSACPGWDDGDNTDDFYAVVYGQPCISNNNCPNTNEWGFVEIVPKSAAADVRALERTVHKNNADNFDAMSTSGGNNVQTYNSVVNGVIRFEPSGSYVDSVDGVAQPTGVAPNWPRAQGDIVNNIGDAKFTIANPRLNTSMTIDFSDQENPRRVPPP